MVYEIYYDTNTPYRSLFGIEIYLKTIEIEGKNKGLWFVELHSNARISGVVDFLKDKFNDGSFDKDQFIKDCYELEELRGWLWETHSNSPRLAEKAEKDMDEWEIYVRERIIEFIKKYDLYLNTD